MPDFGTMFGQHVMLGRVWLDGTPRPPFIRTTIIRHQLDREYIPSRWQEIMCCTVCGCLIDAKMLHKRIDVENKLIYLMCEGCIE